MNGPRGLVLITDQSMHNVCNAVTVIGQCTFARITITVTVPRLFNVFTNSMDTNALQSTILLHNDST